MYQHILVPIDGSETSSSALTHAIDLAGNQKAELILLNIIENYDEQLGDLYLDRTEVEKEMKADSEKLLKESAARVKEAGLKPVLISFAMEPSDGDAAAKIVDLAKEHHSDLIVIGSHGRSGIKRLLLGSVAESVMRLSDIPVLLIHGSLKKTLSG